MYKRRYRRRRLGSRRRYRRRFKRSYGYRVRRFRRVVRRHRRPLGGDGKLVTLRYAYGPITPNLGSIGATIIDGTVVTEQNFLFIASTFQVPSTVTYNGLFFYSPPGGLNNFPDWAHYSALYDSYRIVKAKYRFIPRSDQLLPYQNAGSSYVVTWVDEIGKNFNASGTGTPWRQVALAQADCRRKRADRPFSITMYPKTLVEREYFKTDYWNSLTVGNRPNPLAVDEIAPDTIERGRSAYVFATGVPGGLIFDIVAEYDILFKNRG